MPLLKLNKLKKMNTDVIKTSFCLVIMLLLLLAALLTKDVIESHLVASIGIIMGVLTAYILMNNIEVEE